jgi:hypothetical protein
MPCIQHGPQIILNSTARDFTSRAIVVASAMPETAHAGGSADVGEPTQGVVTS